MSRCRSEGVCVSLCVGGGYYHQPQQLVHPPKQLVHRSQQQVHQPQPEEQFSNEGHDPGLYPDHASPDPSPCLPFMSIIPHQDLLQPHLHTYKIRTITLHTLPHTLQHYTSVMVLMSTTCAGIEQQRAALAGITRAAATLSWTPPCGPVSHTPLERTLLPTLEIRPPKPVKVSANIDEALAKEFR